MKSTVTIQENENNSYSKAILTAYEYAANGNNNIPNWLLNMESMSGKKSKNFFNKLISELPGTNYLEIGTWTGSTACSSMYKNRVNCTFIDNWDQFNPQGNVKDLFFSNTKKCSLESPDANYNFYETDFRTLDYNSIGKYNVYFFDGPHEEQDQYDGVAYAQPSLEDEFIFVCDDWNWNQVRRGTARAFSDLGLKILFSLEIRTSLDGSTPQVVYEQSDWHNGYFIASCRKK